MGDGVGMAVELGVGPGGVFGGDCGAVGKFGGGLTEPGVESGGGVGAGVVGLAFVEQELALGWGS